MAEEQEIEILESFYKCSECSSSIEIIFLDNKNIKYKCFNKKNCHEIKMPIDEYINKMKINHIETNNEKCMINRNYKIMNVIVSNVILICVKYA